LGAQQAFKGAAPRIAQAQPNEMKQLMDEDARKLAPAAIEGDTPGAQEGSGMGLAALVAQAADAFEANRRAGKWGQPPQKDRYALFVRRFLREEVVSERHPYRVSPG